jgi:hypothetical protein
LNRCGFLEKLLSASLTCDPTPSVNHNVQRRPWTSSGLNLRSSPLGPKPCSPVVGVSDDRGGYTGGACQGHGVGTMSARASHTSKAVLPGPATGAAPPRPVPLATGASVRRPRSPMAVLRRGEAAPSGPRLASMGVATP